MINFKDFMKDTITEKLITFGGKAYPKFGQIVILAGGAGSGKGHQLKKIMGIEGNHMDVDALKGLAIGSKKFSQKVKEETGNDIKNFDLRKPENVSKLHEILSDVYGITGANERRIFTAALAADADRKPNLIFDVTLKDMGKLEKITRNVSDLGYEKRNIHIVWVVNDVNVAMAQNRGRDRVVPEEILLATHEGASLTMRKLVDAETKLGRYMDGDIWFTFNKANIDTFTKKSTIKKQPLSGRNPLGGDETGGGSYVIGADYIQIKKQGRKPMNIKDIGEFMIQKISDYTPKFKDWLTQ